MNTTGLETDWKYKFENDVFSLFIQPATHRLNFKEACYYRAKELYNSLANPVLSISGGLDSHMVLHCFYDQALKIDCIFRHFVGYNDNEYNNIKVLEKKYGFKTTVVEMNPYDYKDEMLEEYNLTKIPPNQLLYKKFCSFLPSDLDIIQGMNGPDIHQSKGKLYLAETANSFEFSRFRAVNMLNRTGKICTFDKNSNMCLATLTDETYEIFCNTYDFFLNNQVQGVYLIDYWDVYVKPYIYYKHWKNDLIYFPKYQGTEKIDWIMNGPRQEYRKNIISIPITELKNLLTSSGNLYTKFQSKNI